MASTGPDSPTAVAHLITADAIARGDARIDIYPDGFGPQDCQPAWTRRVPPVYEHDGEAFLRGLGRLGWSPVEPPVEVEYGYATVRVTVPADMVDTVRAATPVHAAKREAAGVMAADLADELGVDRGDVDVLLAQLGVGPDDLVGPEYAAAVRDQVDHYGERSAPTFWWPGSDSEAGAGATRMTFDHQRP